MTAMPVLPKNCSSDTGDLHRVQRFIQELCPGGEHPADSLSIALRHHFEHFGHQTRAELCLQAASRLLLSHTDAIAVASAVECLHNASLIQDDLQDASRLRRGREAVWASFDPDTAICATDFLISAAFRAVGSVQAYRFMGQLVSCLHEAVETTLRGQLDDLSAARQESDLNTQLSIAKRKSGPFFSLSLELPLILAGHHEFLETARSSASHFGLGYQIFDDLKDLDQDSGEEANHNLVLSLARQTGLEAAKEKARELSVRHLKLACDFSQLLPAGAGDLIGEMATALFPRLTRSTP